MIVEELIETLSELTEEQKKLPVYVFADHGQDFESCDTVALRYCHEDEFSTYSFDSAVSEDDIDEEDLNEYKMFVEVGY